MNKSSILVVFLCAWSSPAPRTLLGVVSDAQSDVAQPLADTPVAADIAPAETAATDLGVLPDAEPQDTPAPDALAPMDATTADSALATALAGHWVRENIGNCIQFEDWLSLGAASQFTHTLVDRDFCQEHHIDVHKGDFAILPDDVLHLHWNAGLMDEERWWTTQVVPAFGDVPKPNQSGYVAGTHLLNVNAYVRIPATFQYVRTFHERSTPTPSSSYTPYERQLDVSLSFKEALPAQGACSVKVDLKGTVIWYDTELKTFTDTESFVFPCQVQGMDSKPWTAVSLTPFVGDAAGGWTAYLTDQGVFKKPGPVPDLINGNFLPLFFFLNGQSDVLFSDGPQAWWSEMKTPPPTTIP